MCSYLQREGDLINYFNHFGLQLFNLADSVSRNYNQNSVIEIIIQSNFAPDDAVQDKREWLITTYLLRYIKMSEWAVTYLQTAHYAFQAGSTNPTAQQIVINAAWMLSVSNFCAIKENYRQRQWGGGEKKVKCSELFQCM